MSAYLVIAASLATDELALRKGKLTVLEQNESRRAASPQIDAQKADYISSVKKELAAKRTVLQLVKRKVDRAKTSGRIARSDQLAGAERRADSCLSAVENCIEHLSLESGSAWESRRRETDTALDELSTSVKQLVGRFT